MLYPLQVLVFAPLHNTHDDNDVGGAFLPEAHHFCEVNGFEDIVHQFDNTQPMPERMKQVCGWIADVKDVPALPAEVVAFFCHGWEDGIQAGFHRSTVKALVSALKTACTVDPIIVLYACSTGDGAPVDPANHGLAANAAAPGGEGGFADALRDECLAQGLLATVFAHTVRGHCTENPMLRVFGPDTTFGGEWVVAPHTLQWHAWVHALAHTDLRLRFWKLSADELQAELSGTNLVT